MTEPQERNPYEILQVSPNAEPEVIEAAYRRLARKYHPDVNRHPDATERMKRLNWAYEILHNPAKRREYDTRIGQKRASAKEQSQSSSSAKSGHPRQTPSATIEDITQSAILTNIERSEKIKRLRVKLDPVVRKVLREVGNAHSQWSRKTGRQPDKELKPIRELPLMLDLFRFLLSETSSSKYRFQIQGHLVGGPPYDTYYWTLKWKRFYNVGYKVTLYVRKDGIAILGMDAAYRRYSTKPAPIRDVEHLPLFTIEDMLRAQATVVYREKIGAYS